MEPLGNLTQAMKLLRQRLAEKHPASSDASKRTRTEPQTGHPEHGEVSRAALKRLAEIAPDDPLLKRKATRILLTEIFADQFGPDVAASSAFGAVAAKVEEVWLNDPELLGLTQILAARAREQFRA